MLHVKIPVGKLASVSQLAKQSLILLAANYNHGNKANYIREKHLMFLSCCSIEVFALWTPS